MAARMIVATKPAGEDELSLKIVRLKFNFLLPILSGNYKSYAQGGRKGILPVKAF